MVTLVLKDFRANKLLLLLCGTCYLLFLSVIFVTYEGSMYMFESFMMTKVMIFVVFGFEKRRRSETLCLSLPVKRFQIVLARYLVSLVLLLVGILTFLGLAFVLEYLFPEAPTDLQQLLVPGPTLTYVFLITLLIALFFPLIFRFGMLRGALFGMAVIVPFFAVAPLFFHESAFNGVEVFIALAEASGTPGFYPLVVFTIIVLLGVSALLSIRGFRRQEV